MSDLHDGLAAASATDQQPAAAQDQQYDPQRALGDLRLQRIEELQSEALAKSDALAANLGAAAGSLMRIGFQLEEAIEGTLAKVTPAERFDRLVPAIEIYLKVMRQVDRFAQLELRRGSDRQEGGPR